MHNYIYNIYNTYIVHIYMHILIVGSAVMIVNNISYLSYSSRYAGRLYIYKYKYIKL